MIYLHIGLVISALILFLISGISYLAAIFSENKSTILISENSYVLGLITWILYTILSMLVAYLSWGNVYWQEPRLIIAINAIFVGIIVMGIKSFLKDTPRYIAGAAGSFGIIGIWLRRSSVLHPKAPIRASDSLSVKLLALTTILMIIVSLMLLLTARVFQEREEDES